MRKKKAFKVGGKELGRFIKMKNHDKNGNKRRLRRNRNGM